MNQSAPELPTSDSISKAHRRISSSLVDTPVTYSATFSDICKCQVYFKLENLQMTGSYKERGALNRLLALSEEERKRGVIAASAGNHAQAIAYHAKRLGISAKVVMPVHSPLVKIRSTEHWGAEVILEGETFDDAFAYSQKIIKKENRVYLHPFQDPIVIEGQGTVAVDILNDPLCQDLDAILIPVGGGGLISGVSIYLKDKKPDIQIFGIEEAGLDAMNQSLNAGKVVELVPQPTIADGIAVGTVSRTNLNTVSRLVDQMVSVSSDQIAHAIMLMLEIEKLVIEGAAATTLAALVNYKLPQLRGKKVLCLISGGNIDVNLLTKIIQRGLTFDGRIMHFESSISDTPGALEKMLGIIHELRANVLEVHHHRFSSIAPIGQVNISVTLETRDKYHIDEIEKALIQHGYQVEI